MDTIRGFKKWDVVDITFTSNGSDYAVKNTFHFISNSPKNKTIKVFNAKMCRNVITLNYEHIIEIKIHEGAGL